MDENNYMMTADEVAKELGVSKGFAYKVIRELNRELDKDGYVTISGRIPRAYWETRFYRGKKQLPTD